MQAIVADTVKRFRGQPRTEEMINVMAWPVIWVVAAGIVGKHFIARNNSPTGFNFANIAGAFALLGQPIIARGNDLYFPLDMVSLLLVSQAMLIVGTEVFLSP